MKNTNSKQSTKKHLSRTQKEDIGKVIKHSPCVYGFGINRWTGLLLSQYIFNTYKFEISVRTCQRFLEKLPKERLYKKRENEKDKLLSDMIKDLKNDPDVSIWFMGVIPIWKRKPSKTSVFGKSLTALAALEATDGESKLEFTDKGLKKSFALFIEKLIEDNCNNRKMVLLMHRTAMNASIINELIIEGKTENRKVEFRFIYSRNPKINSFERLRLDIREYMRTAPIRKRSPEWPNVPSEVRVYIRSLIK